MPKKSKKSRKSEDSDYEWEPCNKTSDQLKNFSETKSWLSGVESMDNFLDVFTTSKKTLKNKPDADEDIQKLKTNELNPYWKAGGSGLPESIQNNVHCFSKLTKENESWLRKSYNRCLEQALENGIDVKELLHQRYDKLTVESMIQTFGRQRKLHYTGSLNIENNKVLENELRHASATKSRWKKTSPRNDCSKAILNKEEVSVSSYTNPECPLDCIYEERLVTIDDINSMSAKVMRAELESNTIKLQKLKANLEKLREAKGRGLKVRLRSIPKQSKNGLESNSESKAIALTKINDRGTEVPVHIPYLTSADRSNKTKRFESHDSFGQRIAFLDADLKDQDINDLIREERLQSAGDMDLEFTKLAGKASRHVDDEYADVFVGKRSHAEREAVKAKKDAVSEYKRRAFAESSCVVCLERVPKHSIICIGEKIVLTLPTYRSMATGHCLLSPIEHVGSFTRLDEDSIAELKRFKQQLALLFESEMNGAQCVFVEISVRPDSARSHTRMECIPIPQADFELIPGYFKKALIEIGSEWDQNRRLISLKSNGSGAYDLIPPKFGYVSVEFGLHDGGLARVIDDASDVPDYFAKEIIAGILDIDTKLWRNPKPENFEYLRRKVVNFENWWHKYDTFSGQQSKNTSLFVCDNLKAESYFELEGPALPPDMDE